MPEGALGPRGRVIPESSLTKAPTAELRPNQTDQDSLPPYDELDAILHGLVEEELSVDEIVARGFPRETVIARAAPALLGRIQAAAGAARREDHAQELRPRSAVSADERVSRIQFREFQSFGGFRRFSSESWGHKWSCSSTTNTIRGDDLVDGVTKLPDAGQSRDQAERPHQRDNA